MTPNTLKTPFSTIDHIKRLLQHQVSFLVSSSNSVLQKWFSTIFLWFVGTYKFIKEVCFYVMYVSLKSLGTSGLKYEPLSLKGSFHS